MKLTHHCVSAVLATLAVSMAGPVAAQGAADVRVFPVQGVFWDRQEPAIDQAFLKGRDMAALSQQVHAAMAAAFAGRLGEIRQNSTGTTLAASLHLTRMASHHSRKADGNVEIRTPVTGSIYFSNVLTGEIVFTVTSTNAAVAVVSPKDDLAAQTTALYGASLDALIKQLALQASAQFQPSTIKAQVGAIHQGMAVLEAGYRQGLQSGDSVEDDKGNLLRVTYAGADYALAQPVLADKLAPGMQFNKYVVGKVDGKLRPRATVIVDALPEGFSREYLAQLLSEEMGKQVPLTMVQVNRNFADLLTTVGQQATLSTSSLARRDAPDLIVRLRLGEPLVYEMPTNLSFRTVRHFHAHAFADVIDLTGRILFSVVGSDHQKIEVTNGLDMAPAARRDIAVKNALLDLAEKMGKVAGARPERAPLVSVDQVENSGKSYAPRTNGTILRPTALKLGGKAVNLLLPLGDAAVMPGEGAGSSLTSFLPLAPGMPAPMAGDLFETLQVGAVPKTAAVTSVCSDSENLGSVQTVGLEHIATHALARAMPAYVYAPSARSAADVLVQPATGFREALRWSIPVLPLCVQPVQRVEVSGEECKDQCQKLVTARYTLRIRQDGKVLAREGLESKFRSTGFEKNTPGQVSSILVQADLIDEAQKLFDGVAGKLVFPSKP